MTDKDVRDLGELIAPEPPVVHVLHRAGGLHWSVEYDGYGRAHYLLTEALWRRIQGKYYERHGRDLPLHHDTPVHRVEGTTVEFVTMPEFRMGSMHPDTPMPPPFEQRVSISDRTVMDGFAARPNPRRTADLLEHIAESLPVSVGMGHRALLKKIARWLRFLARRDDARTKYAMSLRG